MQRYRQAFRKKVIPKYYRGLHHVLIFSLLMILATAYFASQIQWHAYSALYILASLGYATTFTYFLHRFMLHKKVPLFHWAHKMHHWHHTFYQAHAMEYESLDDVYMLLMPPWLQFFYFTVYLPGLVLLLSLFLPTDIVMHFVFALTIWYGIYEFTHWIEHLPTTHPLMQNPVSLWLRRHHIVHHSKLKDSANFGIVEPSWDYLMKTKF